MKLVLYLTSVTTIHSKWIKDLSVSHKTVKILEENIGGKLLDRVLGNDFLDMMSKALATKANTNKLDYIKLKNLCTSKETTKEKGTLQKGENICKPCIW